MNQSKVKRLVVTSMLSSISFVLILLDFPFPGLPAYLKIDFSDIPAIIAILIYGPGAGIAVEALKMFCIISFKAVCPAFQLGKSRTSLQAHYLSYQSPLCSKKLNQQKEWLGQ